MIGSSSPNLARNAAATSGGTLGFVASSPNGSPGASASTTNSTRLMPSRLGTAISRRLRRYRLIARDLPVSQLAREMGDQNRHHRAWPPPWPGDPRPLMTIEDPLINHVSRYQSFRFQKSLSQPLKVALSLLDIAATQRRLTTGMTTPSSTTMSFILMNNTARLTGSSSLWAARKVLSYSSLRQRVGLVPCHLLSFEAISHDTNCCIKRSGSGTEGVPVVYIWISV